MLKLQTKKTLAMIGFTTSIFISSCYAQANVKQIVADLDKVMTETEDYRVAKLEMEDEGKKGQEGFMKKKQALEAKFQAFQKQQSVLNEKEKVKRQTDLANEDRQLQEEFYKFKMEFERKSNEKLVQIKNRLEALGREITDDMSGDVFYGIRENSPVYIYARGGINIDQKLKDLYNKRHPLVSSKDSDKKSK